MQSKDVLKEAINEFDGTVIVVSHDRDFLDGLVTKVYEFGGGEVREHLGGVYEFLEKKKIDNLSELNQAPTLSQSPTVADSVSVEPEVEPSPGDAKLSYEAQKEFNRKLRRVERDVAQCEEKIAKLEKRKTAIELELATPDGASDTDLYESYQKLQSELSKVVSKWENYILEQEELEE